MNLNGMDTYAAVIAAVFGGVGVKFLEKLMNKRSEQFLEGSKIRTELRLEITGLRTQVEELKTEAEEWRGKYYDSVEENLTLNQNFEALKLEYKRLQFTLPDPNTLPNGDKK